MAKYATPKIKVAPKIHGFRSLEGYGAAAVDLGVVTCCRGVGWVDRGVVASTCTMWGSSALIIT